MEDVDATLGASDTADVEEDDGADDDSDDEVTSAATGNWPGSYSCLAGAIHARCSLCSGSSTADAK